MRSRSRIRTHAFARTADAGAGSDDDSEVLLRRGVVLYEFTPEEEDEVAIFKGEALDVEYEVGGWLQVRRCAASRTPRGASVCLVACVCSASQSDARCLCWLRLGLLCLSRGFA